MVPDSKDLLTFATPFGRFQFNRLPFGLSASPEIFQKFMNDLLFDLPFCAVYMDDILVFSKSKDESEKNLETVLKRLDENGVKLNRQKCSFHEEAVEFLGYTWSSSGIQISEKSADDLLDAPFPSDRVALRSFLGLATYVCTNNVPHASDLLQPLWRLLKKDEFEIDSHAKDAFQRIKDQIRKIHPRKFFQPDKPVIIQADASGYGLGGVLLQDEAPVIFASRKLTETESRYSQIEKECLALVFAIRRFQHFLFGRQFIVQTDHRPLLRIFQKPVDSISMRLRRWVLALQSYNFEIQFIKGSTNVLADALSRNPVETHVPTEDEKCESTVCFILRSAPVNLKEIAHHTSTDPELIDLQNAVADDWKSYSSKQLKSYYSVRDEVSVKHDKGLTVICKGTAIIIPQDLRQRILKDHHQGHIGMTKMKASLRSVVYWPGLSKDVEEFCRTCDACVRFSAPDSSPMHPVADKEHKPWSAIAVDITGPSASTQGRTLFTVIDLYSRYPFAFEIRKATTERVISVLRQLFALFGMPDRLISDNGTIFRSFEFEIFLKRCSVNHNFSSNYFPQSNGAVERFHSTLKSRISKINYSNPESTFDQQLQRALFDIRSSHNESTGSSPFSLFMGRDMRTTLTSLTKESSPSVPKRDLESRYSRKKGRVVIYKPGDNVYVRTIDRRGRAAIVIRQIGSFSYEVRFPNGRTAIYNQRNMKSRISGEDSEREIRDAAYDATTNADVADETLPMEDAEMTDDDPTLPMDESEYEPDRNTESSERPRRNRRRPPHFDHYVLGELSE